MTKYDPARMQAVQAQHQQGLAQAMQNVYPHLGPQLPGNAGIVGQVLTTGSTTPVWIQAQTQSLNPYPGQQTPPLFWVKINGKDLALPFPQPGQILYCEDDNPRWLYEHEIPRPTMSPPMFSLEEINEYT